MRLLFVCRRQADGELPPTPRLGVVYSHFFVLQDGNKKADCECTTSLVLTGLPSSFLGLQTENGLLNDLTAADWVGEPIDRRNLACDFHATMEKSLKM